MAAMNSVAAGEGGGRLSAAGAGIVAGAGVAVGAGVAAGPGVAFGTARALKTALARAAISMRRRMLGGVIGGTLGL
jgi:hypothetical protein